MKLLGLTVLFSCSLQRRGSVSSAVILTEAVERHCAKPLQLRLRTPNESVSEEQRRVESMAAPKEYFATLDAYKESYGEPPPDAVETREWNGQAVVGARPPITEVPHAVTQLNASTRDCHLLPCC